MKVADTVRAVKQAKSAHLTCDHTTFQKRVSLLRESADNVRQSCGLQCRSRVDLVPYSHNVPRTCNVVAEKTVRVLFSLMSGE